MIREALEFVLSGREIPTELMEKTMELFFRGEATPAQMAGVAIALRMRGETASEIAAAARVMRRHCDQVDAHVRGRVLIDTCGTGGDGAQTFNVSTVTAITLAACGVAVAKHGNRAVSSRCGSADLVEELGVRLEAPRQVIAECIEKCNIGFLFAPVHHGALRHAASVRRELGVRTFFNLLGPLANPAGATHQLLGVYDPDRVTQLAEVLGLLGTVRAWVVHGEGRLDEISPSGPTKVAELDSGRIRNFTIAPEDFGMSRFATDAISGGDARKNAELCRNVLRGEAGPHRDAVVLNAAAGLLVAGVEHDPKEAAAHVARVLDEGRGIKTLETWITLSQSTV